MGHIVTDQNEDALRIRTPGKLLRLVKHQLVAFWGVTPTRGRSMLNEVRNASCILCQIEMPRDIG